MFQLDVRSRKTDFFAELITFHHTATNAVGTPEQALNVTQIPRCQQLPNSGTGCTHAVNGVACHFLHDKPALCGKFLEQSKISRPARTKTEIIANQNPSSTKPLLEDVNNEILRADSREIEIEAAYLHPIHLRLSQKLQLFAQTGEAGRRLVRRKEFPRMRLENHHAGFQIQPIGGFSQTSKHRLVPEMHAIKISDCQRNRGLGLKGNTSANAHEATAKMLNCSLFQSDGSI